MGCAGVKSRFLETSVALPALKEEASTSTGSSSFKPTRFVSPYIKKVVGVRSHEFTRRAASLKRALQEIAEESSPLETSPIRKSKSDS
jgi:hypothetical protein